MPSILRDFLQLLSFIWISLKISLLKIRQRSGLHQRCLFLIQFPLSCRSAFHLQRIIAALVHRPSSLVLLVDLLLQLIQTFASLSVLFMIIIHFKLNHLFTQFINDIQNVNILGSKLLLVIGHLLLYVAGEKLLQRL